jgi:hypothetical protein
LVIISQFLLPVMAEANRNAAYASNSKGSTASSAASLQSNAATQGQWANPRNLPILMGTSEAAFPVHISLLPSGKVLFWGRDKLNDNDIDAGCKTYLWDPLHDIFSLIPNNRTNLFCSGHCFLPDGRLFVAGGHEILTDNSGNRRYELESAGSRQTNYFDYLTETWSSGPDMRRPRWYPSVVTLSNGETQIVAGDFITGFGSQNNPLGGKNPDTEILQLNGTLRNTPMALGAGLPNYPFLHLAPNGRVLAASGTNPLVSRFYNPSTNMWSFAPWMSEVHDQGTSVMYETGKVMVIGGRQSPPSIIPRTEAIDLNQANPSWVPFSPMSFPRYYATSVLMPNGKVFVAGGSRCPYTNNINSEDNTCTNGAILNPEIWEPPTLQFPGGRWTTMAPHQIIRMYHSVAMLLPDGRILVGGGGRRGAYGENGQSVYDPLLAHTDWEIFSPPYLFNSEGNPAKRPAITSAPQRIAYGQSFSIGVGNFPANELSEAVLVRLGSVTHAQNFDQRRVKLAFTSQGEYALNVTAPANGGECPPGPYMLFVLNQNGTPSVAKMIFVGNTTLARDKAAFPASSLTPNNMKGSLQITTQPGVSWAVTNVPSWLTITSATSGTGNATVTYDVQNHTGFDARSATLFVAGLPYTVYQGAEFSDVPQSHLFHDFVGKIHAVGITQGCGGGGAVMRTFCIGDHVRRWQMAVFLISGLGVVPPAGQPNPFPNDVTPATPGYNFIVELAKREITSGCAPLGFCPDGLVNRAQMAVFIERAIGAQAPPLNTPQLFNDVPPGYGGNFYDYINDFARRGITDGCSPIDPMTGRRNYCPESLLTRGEMAVFLTRAFGL